MVVGAAIVSVYFYLSGEESEPVLITRGLVETLIAEKEQQLGHPIDSDLRGELIEDYVDRQVLFREAKKLGLDAQDTRITNLLVDKMRSLLTREPPQPTRSELDSFYEEQKERYHSPDLISFQHIFWTPGNPESTQSEKVLTRKDLDQTWKEVGDPFWLGPTLTNYDREALSTMLGSVFTDQLFQLPFGTWSGPFQSAQGIHLVKITSVIRGKQMNRHEAESLLLQDWLRARRQALLQQEINRIRESYHVIIDTAQ